MIFKTQTTFRCVCPLIEMDGVTCTTGGREQFLPLAETVEGSRRCEIPKPRLFKFTREFWVLRNADRGPGLRTGTKESKIC